MSRVLTSFGFGHHAELLEIATPGFARYAAAHGYDLFIPRADYFRDEDTSRPSSWLKLPLIRRLLLAGAEAVLWIDSDVVVCRHDKDIAEDCGPEAISLVVQQTSDGAVPSGGVMYLRPPFLGLIGTLWGRNGFRRSECWWEQAAIIDFLGGDPDATPVAVPPGPLWGEIPYGWNPHVHDIRGIPADCRFFHATCFPDRPAVMREVADAAA